MDAQSNFVVSPEARRWLARHGKEATLRPSTRNGCCGGSAAVPVAEARRPDRLEDYDSVDVEGVRLHVAQSLALAGTVELRLETLLGFARLFVEMSAPVEHSACAQPELEDD